MSTKRKICIVTSTRADWGLLSPLAHALKARADVELYIVATNMHLLDKYGHTIDEILAEGLNVSAQVHMPDTGDNPADKAHAMAVCLMGMSEAFASLHPDTIIILGDRYEMLAVASAATIMQLPIVHIAGGEISEGAIDDSIRHAISKLASLHLTATEEYRRRVIQMGEQPGRVVNTGALGVWNITHQTLMSAQELSASLGFELSDDRRALLVTYHPATLDAADAGTRCEALLQALDRYPQYRVIITYPNNDPGSEEIISRIDSYAKRNPGRVLLIKSLGMKRYLSALKYVSAVVGNSSSGIVEVPSMGVPTVDIGIRQQGRISAESVIHCGDTADEIAAAIQEALSPKMQALAARRDNPYSRPDTISTMVDAIMAADPKTLNKKKFYDIPLSY